MTVSTIKPKALRPGDTIGVVAPAGPVNRERIDRAFTRIKERGFRIKTYDDIYRSDGYLAGNDATRAAELMAAFADPETSAVWCARGGYGVVRILDRLDFEIIRRTPKVFVGFSDITLLHIAIQQKIGLITFHGPNLQDGFGKPDDMPAANEAALWQAILALGTTQDNVSTASFEYVYNYDNIDSLNLQQISPGIARGTLIGGNLAVIAGVLGTPYEVNTCGHILFLEDVGERVYRIDRYLSQLRLAGKLSAVAGILLGTFSFDEGHQVDEQHEVVALLQEQLGNLGIPVLAGFPAGHDRFNLTLPIGAIVELNADRQTVSVCERPTK